MFGFGRRIDATLLKDVAWPVGGTRWLSSAGRVVLGP
jgi:hypothetical protein